MSTAAHTPGPWKAQKSGSRTYVYDANNCTVCTVARWSAQSERDNARLIAAAPDLLAVAVRLISLESQDGGRSFPSKGDIEAARAAIAKAEGIAVMPNKRGTE